MPDLSTLTGANLVPELLQASDGEIHDYQGTIYVLKPSVIYPDNLGVNTEQSAPSGDSQIVVNNVDEDNGDGVWINGHDNTTVLLTLKSRFDSPNGVEFKRGSASGSKVGSIGWDGSSTSYNTSSDYRLKKDDVIINKSPEWIQKINVRDFVWEETGKKDRGLFAHELQEFRPQAVSGEKDAIREVGNIIDENGEVIKKRVKEPTDLNEGEKWTKTDDVIDPQGVDYSKLIPDLIVSLQEAYNRIEELENKL